MTAGVGTHKIRVAVAGCGEFGRNHVRAYREIETVELVGVFDQDAGRAATIAQEFQTRAFSSLEELRGAVDAASVAVPTIAHAGSGLRAARDGHRRPGGKADGADAGGGRRTDCRCASAMDASCRLGMWSDSIRRCEPWNRW